MDAETNEGRLEVLDLADAGPGTTEWDEFVQNADGGTFCHLSAWQEVMRDVLGASCHYKVAVSKSGAWRGIHPLVRVRSLILGDYLMSMPFLNDGGPLGDASARRALGAAARELARGWGVDLLELRSREAVPGDLTESDRKITVLLDLPDDPDVLWKDIFRSKLRSQVRKPMKEGMEIRFGSDQLDPFYGVFARTMRDLGTPVLPKSFFDVLPDLFPDHVVFACVYREELPMAAGCGFTFGDEFEITWAGSIREHSRKAPNMLLYWGLMERMIERGLETFNFGRCSPGSGTHRFKSQWGGEDVPLPWAQWSADEKAAPPTPEGGVFKLATDLWRRLPLGVANRVGPIFSRRLP